jgi:outer membrane protein TolC
MSTTAVITPQDQIDAVFSLSVPLIDAGSWRRIGGARATADAARERANAAKLDVQKSVARTYFQYVAACALVAAAEQSRDAAKENEQVVSLRHNAGLASDLDLARASADTDRARQSISDAELTRELAARSLETLTGLWPSGPVPPLDDNLAEEAALASWQRTSATLPQVRAAELDLVAAQKSASAAWLAYVPTLSGTVTEHLTNAPGFGQPAAFLAALSLAFRADLVTLYNARALSAATAVSAVRSERTRRDAEDQIFNAWSQIRAYLVRSRAARSQRESTKLAATLSHRRYAAGTATQLEVIQAERDAFSAEVARIQADADLAYSRVLLRLSSGQIPSDWDRPAEGPVQPVLRPEGRERP